MIVAIDGPAAAGKGTLTRLLADYFDLAWLDTGVLYRAVALRLIRRGENPHDVNIAVKAAKSLEASDLRDQELRSEAVGQTASQIAAIVEVRAELIQFQRNFAKKPPGNKKGAVLDGRDIGTVVCPDADFKIFITAAQETRAHRRYLELKRNGEAISEQAVLAATRERDTRDTQRSTSPLKLAEDAYLLDTTNLSIDAAFTALKAYISEPSN